MPPLWTSDTTGQIYPVGVIPEKRVCQENPYRTETQLFYVFKKEDFVR